MVEIDVPGTANDPVVVAVHYKASSDDASRFRKAVEAYRTIEAIAAAGHDSSTTNLFVLGDFNEDHDRFMPGFFNTGTTSFGDGSTLPVSYQLGSDLAAANAIDLPYAQYPDNIFGAAGIITPAHRQQDGQATRTFINLGDAALDYILHSQQVADNGNTPSEIFNSGLDGLSKQATPAAPETSFIASDHFAIFGDYELDPKPKLSLNITPSSLDEDAGAGSATGTVTLQDASASALVIDLVTTRPDSPIRIPTKTLTVAPGETQKTFTIDIIDRPSADPDQTVSISAVADGYSGESDTLLIYNLEPSGRILISQYIEPPSGSAPRGIELFNCGTTDIDLRAEPIRIVQYTNGSTTGNIEGRAEFGKLRAGGVVVIGDTIMGNYLVSQGLLAVPDAPFSSAENGTPYLNSSGDLVYVKEFFPYNGDDALEVQFAYGLSDVFGTIGQDPGTAWQSDGVSTSGRNLSLLNDVATPSAGFTQPHLRFANTAVGNDLTGFGSPPAANDPFKLWLQGFGLSDPNADPDCDGLSNLLEYATGSDPTSADSANPPTIDSNLFSHRRLDAASRLIYCIEQSADLHRWIPAELTQPSNSPNGDGTSTLTFGFAPPTAAGFFRLRVILE